MPWFIALASAFLCFTLAGLGVHAPFRVHMGIIAAVLAIGAVVLVRQQEKSPADIQEAAAGYFDAPIRMGTILTVFWGAWAF